MLLWWEHGYFSLNFASHGLSCPPPTPILLGLIEDLSWPKYRYRNKVMQLRCILIHMILYKPDLSAYLLSTKLRCNFFFGLFTEPHTMILILHGNSELVALCLGREKSSECSELLSYISTSIVKVKHWFIYKKIYFPAQSVLSYHMIQGASEITANLYGNCVHLYWEGCVIFSIYLR